MRIAAALVLVVVGSILTVAMGVDTTYGFNVNTVSVALMIVGDIWAIAEIAVSSGLRRQLVGRAPSTDQPY